MTVRVRNNFLLESYEPQDIPGLISFWTFQEGGETFTAAQGEPYTLHAQAGAMQVRTFDDAPIGGTALDIADGQWLSIPRAECPKLDIHGPGGQVTILAWIRRQPREYLPDQCEFIAGQWNETERTRQYGLFIDIPVWGERHKLFAHLSNVGGPTPCYRNCIDGAMGATTIHCDEWYVVAMSYDGFQGYAWLDGLLDAHPQLNPYPMAGGLHDGGPSGSDFTVAASSHLGRIGSFFCGQLAGLALYSRALTPAEIHALARL